MVSKKFGDIETEKNFFYRNKTPIFLKDVDIEKVLVSNKISFSDKISINEKTISTLLVTCIMINPLYIMFPKTIIICINKWIYFLIEDDDLLENYNTIWDKVSADIKKEFDSEPVYNKKN